jgi:adenylyltransferase/sulfurtransferase
MVETITISELAELMASDSSLDLIDVRNVDEWEAGHIGGVRLVPLDTFRADPDAALAGSRGRKLIFICAKGVRSMQAAKLAERFGYENLYNLDGGTKEWARLGYPVENQTRVAA